MIKFTDLEKKQRHPALRKMEGWYSTNPTLRDLPLPYEAAVRDYEASESKLKFTRWCARNTTLSPNDLATIGKVLTPQSFKLSCSFNDLTRLHNTKHYVSCLADVDRGAESYKTYLNNPNVAVLYIPDAAGYFQWRALVLLCVHDSKYCLYVPGKSIYGNCNNQLPLILEQLTTVVPVLVDNRTMTGAWNSPRVVAHQAPGWNPKNYSEFNDRANGNTFLSVKKKGYLLTKRASR